MNILRVFKEYSITHPPVVAEGVQLVPEDGQPCPPVREHEVHAALLPGPGAAHVEQQHWHEGLPRDEGGGVHGVPRDEGDEAGADPARGAQGGEAGLDEAHLPGAHRGGGGAPPRSRTERISQGMSGNICIGDHNCYRSDQIRSSI